MNSTVILYCPNCGAGLTFDAQTQQFHCEFCLSDFKEEDLSATHAQEQAQMFEQQAQEFCEEMREYECPSCGAQIVCDEHTAADFCYYCHNPVILNGRLDGQKRPHKIIPFRYDKAAAEERFLAFAKKKRFLPRDFFSQKQADKILIEKDEEIAKLRNQIEEYELSIN
jgi:DNA-directed RNA polymerase subunit RPC12/RpoP